MTETDTSQKSQFWNFFCAMKSFDTETTESKEFQPLALVVGRALFLRPLLKWIPALALPGLAIIFGRHVPRWQFMWLIALALFCGAKWLTIFPWFTSKE